MKKHLVSITRLLTIVLSLAAFAIPAASQAQVTAVVCPVGYTCNVLPPCPAGWTCTPVSQPAGCPSGYYCLPVSSSGGGGGGGGGYSASTTGATVSVVGTPTLQLTYDSLHNESALTGTLNLSVTAGYSDLYLYTGIAGGNLSDQKGNSAPMSMQVNVGAGEKTNQYGDYTIVPAGHSVQMSVVMNANPKQLFAGTYHGSVSNLFVFASDGTPAPVLSIPSNRTNDVTIVGETSPYITGFGSNQPFTPGQTVAVLGQRLDVSGGIFIDGNSIGNAVKGDITSFGLNIPNSLATGYHTLQVKSVTTGASNNVTFQVQNSGGSCGYVFSINLAMPYPLGPAGYTNSGPDVVALQTWLIANGYDIPAVSSGLQPKGTYYNQTARAVAQYQAAKGISERYAGYAYVGPLTRQALNGSCNTPTPVSSGLTITGVTYSPATPHVNDWITTTVTVVNNGSADYTKPFTINVQGTTKTVNFLAAHAYTTLTFPNVFSFSTPGVKTLNTVFLNGEGSMYTNTLTFTDTNTCPGGNNCGTPTTTPPVNTQPISFQAVFNKSFNVANVPSSANLAIAADNNYYVWVNDQYVGAGRNESSGNGNNNFDNVTNFNIASKLHAGTNSLRITAQNYYSTYTTWPNNAMGLIYKVTDQYGSTLAASDGTESIGIATVSGGSSVVLSQPHSWWTRIPGASWIWDSADPLYASYLSYTGQGQTQTCPSGQTWNASWGTCTVQTQPTATQPYVKIVSPNGGQTYSQGQVVPITFTTNLTSQQAPNGFNIWAYYGGNSTDVKSYSSGVQNIAMSYTGGTTYNWTVPTSFAAGNYVIYIVPATVVGVSNTGLFAFGDSYFTVKSSVVNPPTVTPPTGSPSVGASVVDGSSDKAGTFGVFGPGKGAQNSGNPYDWHFVATIITWGKTIKSIRVLSNDNWQGWSTIDPGNYPMVVYQNGTQLNSSYSSLNKTGDTVSLDLYGQPETSTWPGGNILVTFTDGTTASASIPSSSVTIPSNTLPNLTVSNLSSTLGSSVVNQNTTVAYNVSFSFTLTAGNSTVYVSANPSVFAPNTVTGNPATGNLPNAGIAANPGQVSGDTNVNSTSGYYVIPAGTYRQFTLQGSLAATSASNGGFTSWQINQINYGTSPSSLQSSSIPSGLQNLKVTATGLSALPTAPAVTPTDSASYTTTSYNQSPSLTASIWDAIRAYYAH